MRYSETYKQRCQDSCDRTYGYCFVIVKIILDKCSLGEKEEEL